MCQILQLGRHTGGASPVHIGQHHQHFLQQELHGRVAKLGHMDGQRTQNQQPNLQGNMPLSSNLQLCLPFGTCTMSIA